MGEVRTSQGEQTKEIYRWFYTESLFGEKYQERQNNRRGHSFLSCVFCGRDTSKQGKSNGVMVGGGGGSIIHPEDYEKSIDGGSMGWFPVGSECIKEVPKEFRIANIYEDKGRGV